MLTDDTVEGGGLYIIWLSDTHYYGGRARIFRTRWRNHLRDLKAGKHENPRMQAVYNIHGRFEPKVVLTLAPKEQTEAEQVWLDANFRKPGCVNLSPHSKGGCENRSPETRAKMAVTRASRPDLVEQARKSLAVNRLRQDPVKVVARAIQLSVGNIGRTQSAETIAKRADTHRGRKNTEETKALMAESARKRAAAHPTEHGLETRALISTQQKGRIWINNGTANQRLFPEDAQTYFEQGWVRGKLPHRPRLNGEPICGQ